MLIVTDINGVTEALTDYKELTIKQRVNGEHSLSFVLLATERNEHSYSLVQEESVIEHDGQEYRIKKLEERSRGEKSVKQVQAQHIYFDLIDDYRYDIVGGTKTITDLLTYTLTGTDFTFEVADTFDTLNVFNFGENNVLTLNNQILELYQAEIEINGKHLVFKKQIGSITDFQFRYKHNLKTISKGVDTSKLATKIRGYWRNGFVDYTSTMSTTYGIRHAEPIRNDDITDEATMLQHLQRVLNDKPDIAFKIDFVELQKLGYESSELGDEIFVIYEPLNIDITARIMETDKVLDAKGNVIKSTVTLANFRESVTDIFSLLSNTVKQVEKKNEINKSEIRQSNEQIELRVTKTTYDTDINAVSTGLKDRMTTAEGEIAVNADNITLKVSETDYNGDTIIGKINVSSSTVTISAQNVDLYGSVSFSDLDTNTQSTINSKVTNSELSTLGSTTINGGNITTGVVDAQYISTNIQQVNNKLHIGGYYTTGTEHKGLYFESDARLYTLSTSPSTLNISAQNIVMDYYSYIGSVSSSNRIATQGDITTTTIPSYTGYAGSHSHGGATGSVGDHNHGITPGRYLRTYDSAGNYLGLQYWNASGGHSHSISSESSHRHSI